MDSYHIISFTESYHFLLAQNISCKPDYHVRCSKSHGNTCGHVAGVTVSYVTGPSGEGRREEVREGVGDRDAQTSKKNMFLFS